VAIGANAKGTAIGTGYKNTLAIISQDTTANRAGTISQAYRGPNNLTDWYLASKDELAQLYEQKSTVGGFVAGTYWSSSEYSELYAWAQYFTDGTKSYNGKFGSAYVRPVRAFGAGSAAKVAITRASVGTQRRTAFTTQPQITIQDSGGTTITSSAAVVTATVSAGGTLVGTTTSTASSGVATFTGLGVDGTIGTSYTITYTAVGLTIATETVTLTGITCDGTTFTCQVGDTGPGGGKIFYVASTFFTQVGASGSMCTTNCKYLEAAPNTWSGGSVDPERAWVTDANSNQTTLVTGADETAIGTGYRNSLDIVGQTGNVAASSAAVAARGYTGGSKNDWFLPSEDELNQLHLAKTIIGGFYPWLYWSSSEIFDSGAMAQYFMNESGDPRLTLKSDVIYVRPIRAF
jgi:hypothetical protein